MQTETRPKVVDEMAQPVVETGRTIIDRFLAFAEAISARLEAWARDAIEARRVAAVRSASSEQRFAAGGTQWNVIPSSEGSMMRLAGERTTVMLSPEQVEKRRAARRIAKEDPQAYLKACREGKP